MHTYQIADNDDNATGKKSRFRRETKFQPEHDGECQSHPHQRCISGHHYILLHQSRRTYHLANSCQINSTGKLEDDNENNNNPRFQLFRNEVTDSRNRKRTCFVHRLIVNNTFYIHTCAQTFHILRSIVFGKFDTNRNTLFYFHKITS